MYRIAFLSDTFYAKKITSVWGDIRNIEAFTDTEDPVILVNSLDKLPLMGIDLDRVVEVPDEEDDDD